MIRQGLIFLFVLSSHILYSQDRVNKPLPKISKVIQKQLTTATGWMLNPEGQWVSRKNRIPYFIENKSKILIDYETYGLGMDNFVFFQLRDVKISDSTYYVLIKKYRDGYYRYRSIQKG